MSNTIDPFTGLTSIHSQLDDVVSAFLNGPAMTGHSIPTTDIYTDNSDNLVAEIQAPGFTKNDVEINVHNGMLEIKGEKHDKEEQKDKKRSYMMRESRTSFYRNIALPKGADADKVKAHFNEGVLTVTVPLQELPAPKKITISDGKKK